ncbi:MAG: DUF72 domain-containing protein [Proteobacteria bacterium]|nr:DUF72 domain-containing protein [Pseudomonadota bacterium]
MRWLAGTSGFSYTEWRGPFYPDDLQNEDMPAFYATRLPAVEINNTFYRMPRREVLTGWSQAVPYDFRFVIKASRRITHQQRLLNAEESIEYLASRLDALEDKLGAVLFQPPPNFKKNSDRLQALLNAWPSALPAAIEFRHDSWFDDETLDALREKAVALVISEDGDLPLPPVLGTTDWVYLRLRKPGYTTADLNGWIRKTATTQVKQAYAFFKHEDEAAGPELAERFLSLTSKPLPKRAAPRKVARAKPGAGKPGKKQRQQ